MCQYISACGFSPSEIMYLIDEVVIVFVLGFIFACCTQHLRYHVTNVGAEICFECIVGTCGFSF